MNARLSYQTLGEDAAAAAAARSANDLPADSRNDEYAMLVCAAQSQPPPTFTWYRVQANGQRTPIPSVLDLSRPAPHAKQPPPPLFNNSIDNSLKQADLLSFSDNLEPPNRVQSFRYMQWAGVLFIRHFNLRDDGLYTCVVNNTYDEERLDTRLSIQGTVAGSLLCYS